MNKRRIERVAVMSLSIALMLSSTGILSSFAANVNETSSSSATVTSTSTSSTTVTQEGGKLSTTSDVVTEGGNLVVTVEGEGTKANPYVIATADDFLKMQEKINLTTSEDKYFVLGDDIDLSDVKQDALEKNAGSVVTVNKSLANATKNVFFVLDGNGHTIKGFDVKSDKLSSVSIFGYLNSKSAIRNLTVVSANVASSAASVKTAAVLVAENEGTIDNVTVKSSKLTLKNAENAGLVVAINNGTVSNVTVESDIANSAVVTADHNTISGTGSIGAVAGTNNGKITNASAINVGMYIPADAVVTTVYGGIVGTDSGAVSNSVSTGAVAGGKSTDYAGGVIGKATKGATVNNTYTLVKLDKTMNACAVIGLGGTSDMLNDCYWSSAISNCSAMVSDFGAGVNDVSYKMFRVVGANETITFNPNTTWGKASINLDGNYKLSGTGISATVKDNNLVVKGLKNDTLNGVSYATKISLPSTVGNGTDSVILTQKLELPIIVGDGKGTAESPFVIENATDFGMLGEMTGVCAKLAKDITISKAGFMFVGALDGAGHTITTSAQLFTTTIGSVKNVNVKANGTLSTAVFGNAVAVNTDNINVNASLTIKSNNTGVIFNTISGKSTLNDVNIIATVKLADNVKNFGAVAGAVNGNSTEITNCGVHTEITAESGKKVQNVANFIGVINGENVSIRNSAVSGTNSADKYSFVAEINNDNTTISNIYMTKGTQSPLDFTKYSFIKEAQFTEWNYEQNNVAFFTGNSGSFAITLPDIQSMKNAQAGNFSLSFDSSRISAEITRDADKLCVSVNKVKGVVTVKASPVVITDKENGLSIALYVSNGLEKDGNGNYIVTNEYDLTYIGENINELKNSGFVVTQDIDMSAITGYTPIGSTVESFSGKFNGNGHTISNLKINSGAKAGLFGAVENADIRNIVLDKAEVKSNGGYASVLVGHMVNTNVENITITNSKINTTEKYSGVLAGYVSGGSLKNISIDIADIESTANNVGAVAGIINNGTVASEISVKKLNAKGAEFVAGVAGLISDTTRLSDVKVTDSTLVGTTNVSGVASGDSADASLVNSSVDNSKISTIGAESAYVAGGISSSFAGKLQNVKVNNTEIRGGIAAGIVGKTIGGCKLNINGAEVVSTNISAKGANTIASGIIAVHNTDGDAEITGCYVAENTVVSSAAVTSGLVGMVLGNNSELSLKNSKSFATVKGCEDADAYAAAGIVGVIGVGALNNVKIDSVNVLGKVSGVGAVAGGIGAVNATEKFDSDVAILNNCVIASQLGVADTATQERSGMIIGAVESDKTLNDKNIDSAISNVVITTYYPNTTSFGASSKLESKGYYDMDKPQGKAITPSADTLTTTDETKIELSNLPEIKAFKFDSASGWVSESAERIEVISSTENTVVLKSEHMADIGIVGYYVSSTDSSVRIPVHFEMKSDVRIPLKGSGTKSDPYLVSSAYDLETVSTYDTNGKFFALSKDITFKDADFEFGGAFYNIGNGLVTIGSAESGFKGTFTGLYNGVVHSINDIRVSGNEFGGLFGATDGAEISDIIIRNADVKGLNYAGVLVGKAKDTVIRNIVIEDANVETSELCGITGGLVGYAENVMVTDVKANGLSVKTINDSTSATVEIAGGIAGIFSGTISKAELDSVKVESAYLAGGIVGYAKNGATAVNDVKLNADVKAVNAAGVIGEIENPLVASISDVLVKGTVIGEKLSAGVIGTIDEGYSLANADKSLIKNTVITAKVNEAEVSGIAVAKTSIDTFVDANNDKCNVFEEVYYSSANNSVPVFGDKNINAYQIEEYKVDDLNEMKYVLNGTDFAYIPFSSTVDLSDGKLVVPGVEGNYKEFTAGGTVFTLESVSGNASYENEMLVLNEKSSGSVIHFNYNDGLTLDIKISENDNVVGNKTNISYRIVDATENSALSNKTVGILLKSILSDEADSFSFYTKTNSSVKSFGSIYVDDGFYVDMDIPTDLDFEVKAVSGGNELKVKDKDNEGLFVKTEGNENVEITITVKDAESIWGLRTIWSNID